MLPIDFVKERGKNFQRYLTEQNPMIQLYLVAR